MLNTMLHFGLHFRILNGGKGYTYYTITLYYNYIEIKLINKNKNKFLSYIGIDQSVILKFV